MSAPPLRDTLVPFEKGAFGAEGVGSSRRPLMVVVTAGVAKAVEAKAVENRVARDDRKNRGASMFSAHEESGKGSAWGAWSENCRKRMMISKPLYERRAIHNSECLSNPQARPSATTTPLVSQ